MFRFHSKQGFKPMGVFKPSIHTGRSALLRLELKLKHLESGQKEMRSEVKELDQNIKDRVGTKRDRILYSIISHFVYFLVKGYYDQNNEPAKSPDAIINIGG